MSDTILRLCVRVADASPLAVLPGSVVRRCGRCDAAVWYDPLLRLPVNYAGLPERLVCIPCAEQDPALKPDVDRLRDNPVETARRAAEALRNRIGGHRPDGLP